MMKRLISLLLVLILPALSLAEEAAVKTDRLVVGNPTAMTGSFLSSIFDGTTSDMDVRDLLHGYSLVCWDGERARFRFDRSVVEDAVVINDEEGNRNYLVVLYDDLYYSDGTRITASDYAFSLLLSMDPAIDEIGGRCAETSWLLGADTYEPGQPLRGLRVLSDQILEITVKADALPYFYELGRLVIKPFPVFMIAPGTKVRDDGEGAYLTRKMKAEDLKATLLNEKNGYVNHPSVVSGPYQLVEYDGSIAKFTVNPYYKGDERGIKPSIENLVYRQADNGTMISELQGGEFGLLNKVSAAEAISGGMNLVMEDLDTFAMQNYARDGLTLIWFCEDSDKVQDLNLRKAVAWSLDRDGFTKEYAGNFGVKVDGLYGVGTWMYLLTEGTVHYIPDETNDEARTEETEETAETGETIELEEHEETGYEFSLEGMTTYSVDPEAAGKALDAAGWKLNSSGQKYREGEDSIRYKRIDGKLTGLTLTMAVPDSDKTVNAMRKYFLPNLKAVGIDLQLVRLSTAELAYAYMEGAGYDMIYAGDNFSVIFNVYFVRPTEDPASVTGASAAKDSLTLARQELYEMALDMVHTDNADVPEFERKWIALQERCSETLTVIPVYSNVYFDFYERELHGYDIAHIESWPYAVLPAYFSEIEVLTAAEKTEIRQTIRRFEQ